MTRSTRRLTEKRILGSSLSRKSALCTRQLTEKCILGSSLSRKSTLCASGVTKSRILDGRRDGKAHSDRAPHQKTHSACEQSRTMRFSVRACTQNASFRRMRFSSPAQTWRRLTEKRILWPGPPDGSRKSAVCDHGAATQRRTLSSLCCGRIYSRPYLYNGRRTCRDGLHTGELTYGVKARVT